MSTVYLKLAMPSYKGMKEAVSLIHRMCYVIYFLHLPYAQEFRDLFRKGNVPVLGNIQLTFRAGVIHNI